jgi:Tfp pilus assembly protein PilP
MKPIIAALVAVLALALAACGQSSSDKAKSTVCDARSDISKQVDTLKGLTPSTATTSQIKDSVTAISDDLKKIADAQDDLNGDRKAQVQEANQQFTSQIKQIAGTLLTSTSVADAKTQLSDAIQQLASTYQQTFAKVDCG